MGDADDHPEQALRELDAELAATIDRLQHARSELGLILEHSAPTDLPPEFVAPDTVAKMTDADRSLVVVLTRVLGPRGMAGLRRLLRNAPDEPAASAFDDLPADADEATRQDLAERLVPYIRAIYGGAPRLGRGQGGCPRWCPLRRQDHRRRDVGALQRRATRRPPAGRRDPALSRVARSTPPTGCVAHRG